MPDSPIGPWRRIRARLGRDARDGDQGIESQLERSIAEAREQHQLLTEQAATIIAGQTRATVRLERSIAEYERTTSAAQEALILADASARAGDPRGAADQERVAEARAARIVGLERDIEELSEALLEASAASDAARAVVARSAALLRERLNERERLLSRLAQSKLQEHLNAAHAQLDHDVRQDEPTVDDVRRTIEARLQTARALSELRPEPIDETRIRLDQDLAEGEALTRLDAIRRPLGLESLGLRSSAGATIPPPPDPQNDRSAGAGPT